MRYSFLLLMVFTITLSAGECNNKKKKQAAKDTVENKEQPGKNNNSNPSLLKGRLEVAGICMNYTIALIEGKMDTALVESKWTDETTNKSYSNVFRLGNPCAFPGSIKQGNEFNFIIDTSSQKLCPVCLAYYPTPSKAIAIKVVE